MTTSPIISLAAERVRRGEPAFTYTPTLPDAQAVRVMRDVYEIPPNPRLVRGSRPITAGVVALWLVAALAMWGGLFVILGAVRCGLESLMAMRGAR